MKSLSPTGAPVTVALGVGGETISGWHSDDLYHVEAVSLPDACAAVGTWSGRAEERL
jgi:hypothetical protein